MNVRRIAVMASCAMALASTQMSFAQNAPSGAAPSDNNPPPGGAMMMRGGPPQGAVLHAPGGPNGAMGSGPGPGGPNGGWHHGPPKEIWQELKLTEEQKKKVSAIRAKAHPQMVALHERMRQDAQADQKLVSDKEKIDTFHRQMDEKYMAILTPEQRTQLKALRAKEHGPDEHGGPGGHDGHWGSHPMMPAAGGPPPPPDAQH